MLDAISNSSFRLDRALRLEELLLAGSAIPLPSDPIVPTAETDRDAMIDVSSSDHDQTRHADSKDLASQPVVHEASQHQDVQHQDGLTASLQASADAIHQSLAHDMPTSSSSDVPASSPSVHVSEADAGRTGVQAVSAGMTLSVTANSEASSASELPDDTHSVLAGLDHGALSNSPIAEITSGAAKVTDALVASAFHQAGDLTASLSGTVEAVAGALTVPSLHGVGVDSLVGLVQPMSVPLALVTSTVDAAVTSLDHPILSAPIGLEDVHHVDSAVTHLIHPVGSLIGSGLI